MVMRLLSIDIILLLWHHRVHMRTTLNLDDDVLEMVRQYSRSPILALGKAASELVRRGFASPTPTRMVNGIVVFDLPPDSPKITTERIKELESESGGRLSSGCQYV